jgi:hypothetical protein
MTRAQIMAMQEKIGTTADGFWGPKSIAAVQQHLRALMPRGLRRPQDTPEGLRSYYGRPGSGLVSRPAPCPLRFEGQLVRTITAHEHVIDSLCRALAAAYQAAPKIVVRFDGIYARRKRRGGSTMSTHAFGAAIDLDADNNGNHVAWPVRATMPLEVMEAFAREGWVSAGAFWGRDAMHHQFTTP